MSYRDEVLAVFDNLYKNWWPKFLDAKFRNLCKDPAHSACDFWHTANTLDTCVDFILEGCEAGWGLGDRPGQVRKMIEDSHEYFRLTYSEENKPGQQSPTVWWDDYGWWGITFTKIYQNYSALFGVPKPGITREQCLKVATDCWKAMHDYSEDVNRSLEKDPDKRCPVGGGVWNHDRDHGGIQNTVTNGLFLVLSARLFQSTPDSEPLHKDFLDGTARQYLWFRDWFVEYFVPDQDKCSASIPPPQTKCPPCPPQKAPQKQRGLFRCLQNPNGFDLRMVAYERAHDPDHPEYNNYDNATPPFLEGQLWSGDQGLILGGLAEVLALQKSLGELEIIKHKDSGFPVHAQTMVGFLLSGITWLMDTEEDVPKVLHEAFLCCDFLNSYYSDYATGKGVLVRYLDQGAQSVRRGAKDYITANAKAVMVNAEKHGHQVSFRWNDHSETRLGTNEAKVEAAGQGNPKFVATAHSAGLDALNAGIQYLKDQ